jgi:hypothetical protein
VAQTRVVVMVCDSCGTEGDTNAIKNYSIKNNNAPGKPRVFDACEVCIKPVQELLDQVRNSNGNH